MVEGKTQSVDTINQARWEQGIHIEKAEFKMSYSQTTWSSVQNLQKVTRTNEFSNFAGNKVNNFLENKNQNS